MSDQSETKAEHDAQPAVQTHAADMPGDRIGDSGGEQVGEEVTVAENVQEAVEGQGAVEGDEAEAVPVPEGVSVPDATLHEVRPAEETKAEPVKGDARKAGAASTSAEGLMSEAAKRIAELEAERDNFRDLWMRAEAETQNVRARGRREVEDARQYAVQKFAKDVVEAAENLRRGLSSLPAPSDDEPEIVTKLRDGFEGVERSFVALLERNGIKAEDPVGKLFDANLHQAMAEQVSAEHPPGTVVQSWSRGWTLNGRLLRPAMVVVAKAEPLDKIA
jgi:molecular chaperone GrpE